MTELTPEAYTNLLRFRTALRRFDSWSHEQAARVGLSHAQHQLLLAVKGHPEQSGPTIRDVADYLNTRHHSAVGLVDRAERAGLLRRNRDRDDGRVVRLALTPLGEDRIARLSELHLAELAQLAPLLDHLVGDALDQAGRLPSTSIVADVADVADAPR
jgi:DNA-binding MarR family transcriptional regulator